MGRSWAGLRLCEAPTLLRLGGPLPTGARVVEIGYGTRLILDRFGAAHVNAVDLDPQMIERARRRLRRYRGRGSVWTTSLRGG